MKFLTKADAISYYIKNNSDKKLHLFQEDINRAGNKQFYVLLSSQILNKIKKYQNNHFYEFWTDRCKLKFSLDIDIKTSDLNGIKIDEKIKNIIINVINGAKIYYDYQYDIGNIIVLKNDDIIQKKENPNKISYHVIFNGLVFDNYICCKDFFIRLSKDYDMSWCDKAIYNMTCFRLCFNSKMGKNAILMPVKYIINNKATNYMNFNAEEKEFNKFWLDTLITHIDMNHVHKLIDKSYIKTSTSILKPKVENTNDVSNINLEKILFDLPLEYCDDYDKWIKIGMILCNISHDNYDLWYKWSEQSEKFDGNIMQSKWKSFINDKNNRLSIGTLIKWCKDSGIVDIYKNVKQTTHNIVDSYPKTDIVISKNYMDKALILNMPKLNPSIFTPYLKSKLLAIQSEKGTGKTSNLLEALFDKNNNMFNDKTSILFISSRRTFGIKLLNDLKEHKFKLYSEISDQYIVARRIICQIDSLMRLERDSYDYVIIDECESLARYLTSSHFIKNPKANMIVSYLELRVREAKNVYIMDADLSDRCLNYFSNIKGLTPENTTVTTIINTYKPYVEYKICYMSYVMWLNQILVDIEINKKLVIPMASNSKAKDLLTKINNDYPEKTVLLIHKETSDEEKLAKLLRVNEIWNTYDIVIYTPSVCMGVSFDVPDYFDNIYAYGCSNSLGAQEFCQMLHRVRKPKNNIIYLSVDYYKEYDTDDIITYQLVEKMLCSNYYLTSYDLHNNLLPKKIEKHINKYNYALDLDVDINNNLSENKINIVGENIISYPYKNEPIYDLYIRNSMEIIDNKLNFSAQFFGYVKNKEYQLENILPNPDGYGDILQEMKDIKYEREEELNNSTINAIFEAPDISKEDYYNKIKQKDEYVSEKDIATIRRYNMVSCYKLDKVENKSLEEVLTKEFIEIYHDKTKMKWYRNLITIMATDTQNTKEKLKIMKENNLSNNYITNCYLDFTTKNKYPYHYYATELINSVNLDLNELTKTITQIDLETSLLGTMEWCEQHKLDIALKFDLPKTINKNLSKFDKLTDKLKYINLIIYSQYGFHIKKIKQSKDPNKILYGLCDHGIWENILYFQPTNIVSIIDKQEQIYNTVDLDLFLD